MTAYIERKYFIEKIKAYFDKDIIKVIAGQRPVEKSCFLHQMEDEIKMQI